MGTGTKVAIGCGIAAVMGGVVLAAVVFGGIWWAKGKAEQFTGHEAKIEELKKKADAVPFTEPADGVVREDRLVKFLEVRRRVFDVYAKHKDELEAMNKKKQAGLSDLAHGLGVLGEVRNTSASTLWGESRGTSRASSSRPGSSAPRMPSVSAAVSSRTRRRSARAIGLRCANSALRSRS